MDDKTVHIQNEILFICKEKWNHEICRQTDRKRKYHMEWSNPGSQTPHLLLFVVPSSESSGACIQTVVSAETRKIKGDHCRGRYLEGAVVGFYLNYTLYIEDIIYHTLYIFNRVKILYRIYYIYHI